MGKSVYSACECREKVGNNMNLIDTAVGMVSSDYRTRFWAEYWQTKIRYKKLHNMIVKYEAGTLQFQPKCSIDLLRQQANAMGRYLYLLEVRAEVEGIDLSPLEGVDADDR